MKKLELYGVVGQSPNTMTEFKKSLDEMASSEKITLMIDSEGGSVVEGFGIGNCIKACSTPVHGEIVSYVASISTHVANCCASVKMPKNGLYIIHNPFTNVQGDAEQLRETAEKLDKMKDMLVNSYVEKSKGKLNAKQVSEMMDEETWMTGEEAFDCGLVDTLTEEHVWDVVDMSLFKNFKKNLINKIDKLGEKKMSEEVKTDVVAEVVAEVPAVVEAKVEEVVAEIPVVPETPVVTETPVVSENIEKIEDKIEINEVQNLKDQISLYESKIVMKDKEIENCMEKINALMVEKSEWIKKASEINEDAEKAKRIANKLSGGMLVQDSGNEPKTWLEAMNKIQLENPTLKADKVFVLACKQYKHLQDKRIGK